MLLSLIIFYCLCVKIVYELSHFSSVNTLHCSTFVLLFYYSWPGFHSTQCSVGTEGVFLGLKRQGREADHLYPSSVED